MTTRELADAAVAQAVVAPLVARGEIIESDLVEYGGRNGDLRFLSPDVRKHLGRIPLGSAGRMADLYAISFEDIVAFLAEVGARLDVRTNAHLRRARELSYRTAPTTPPLVDAAYERMRTYFKPEHVREMASLIGLPYLEGWVEHERVNGVKLAVRCFGARTLHIVAGNSPMISASSIVRNAILRSDAIIKAPSNDPFTALAIARTMIEVDPTHPLTRHLTVAYWRGGDTEIEEQLYQPHNIEKIVAWGGFASIKHVTRYIQPGLELISLDPKRSASVVGADVFRDDDAMRAAAVRIAADMGGLNQVACVNARVVYVQSGTDDAGLERLNRLGDYVYQELMGLPQDFSTKPKDIDRELRAHVEALRLDDSWYKVVGGEDDEGAVIVSQLPQPVDFQTLLGNRTANLVPVDSVGDMLGAITAYTQTVGVYPESLKRQVRDEMALYGAQRFVSLGYATSGSYAAPQDGLELLRRMGKWIVDEASSPETVAAPWSHPG